MSKPAGPWMAALWASVGLVALFLLAVQTTVGQRLDQAAMVQISEGFAAAGATAWAQAVLAAVSAGTLVMATAVVLAVGAVLRGGSAAVVGAGAAAATVLLAQVLKSILERPDLVVEGPGNSYPSGHVAAVCGLGVALVVVLPRVLRWPVVALLAAPAVLLTGLATVVLLWHRPSDVIGSVLLAVAVGAASLGLLRRLQATNHEGESTGIGSGQHHRRPLLAVQPQPPSKRSRVETEPASLDLQRSDAGAARPLT